MRYVGLDFETRDLTIYKSIVWSITIMEMGRKSEIYHDCNGLKKCPARVKQLCESKDVTIIMHNSSFDGTLLLFKWGVEIQNIGDTKLWEQIIQGLQLPAREKANRSKEEEALYKRYGVALDYTFARYGLPVPDKTVREGFIDRPIAMPFTKTELKYMVQDVEPLPKLYKMQEYVLKRDGLIEVALLESLVAKKVIRMRAMGLGVDAKLWMEIADQNLQAYHRAIKSLPGTHSWGSEKQVKAYFLSRGVRIDSYKNLEKIFIQCRDPLLGKFIKIRQMYSDATAYGAKWLQRKDGTSTVDPDGRIRYDVEQILETARFATKHPNILALPREGRQ